MANETTELSIDEQLEALGKETGSAPAKGAAAAEGTPPTADGTKPAGAPPPAGVPAKDGTPPADEKTDLEKALDDLKEDDGTEGKDGKPPAAPAVSEEHQMILRAIPDATTAINLHKTSELYNTVVQTFESGDLEQIEKLFDYNPAVLDTMLENIYEKYVKNGDWVTRFIDDVEGRGHQNKGLTRLERTVQTLQNQLKAKEQQEQQSQSKAVEVQAFQKYNAYVHDLFDKIKFAEADREWVVTALNAKLAASPELIRAVKNGDLSKIIPTFKTTVRNYALRDKQNATTTNEKIDLQTQKKAPLGAAGGTVDTTTIPDDVRQVPKGQEDAWEDSMIGRLKQKVFGSK
jgi:ribosome-binding protein aMBF1 (putative translation factor)